MTHDYSWNPKPETKVKIENCGLELKLKISWFISVIVIYNLLAAQ